MTAVPRAWSVPVRIEDVPETGRHFELAADAATRTVLARTAGIDALPQLHATFDVARHGGDGLKVTGTVSATVRQTCVVTLEPVENEVAEAVNLTFVAAPGEAAVQGQDAGDLALAGPEPPEALVGRTVDLGAVATEFLILGIDPYPRKAGAVFAAPAPDEASGHPFAALAALKKPGS
jgi:Large ribosomal RNA subunit accumulation protein YceD